MFDYDPGGTNIQEGWDAGQGSGWPNTIIPATLPRELIRAGKF